MKQIFYSIIYLFLSLELAFAWALSTARFDSFSQTWNEKDAIETSSSSIWFFDSITSFFKSLWKWLLYAFIIFVIFVLIVKLIRILFELYYSKDLRYLKITLPRADSKLDKEHETKKDFKEKIGMMSMFYKAVHKLAEAWAKDSILNFIFNHSKISLELVYDKSKVSFFIVTYKNHVNLITQHLSSIYNDAEILIIDPKKDYVDLKEKDYFMRAASLWKEHDDVFPVKTFKYLEDDPINNFTNVFGWLDPDDKAVFQMVIKPEPSSYNEKSKKAAWLVAKWQYKKNRNNPIAFLWKPFEFLWNPLRIMIEGMDWAVKNQNNAPWASEWDSYKIFNQAETESQKLMWEAAAQPVFSASIRVLVSSKNYENCQNWVHSIVSAASIFTDEYNNALDNPQIIEDMMPGIISKIRYFDLK